jgi:hypothetical protein
MTPCMSFNRSHRDTCTTTVQSGTECRNGVPSRLALVLSDGRDPHLARAEEQVPIVRQVPAASYDGVHRQVDPLSDHVLSGPLGKQGVSESIHDGEVVSGLRGSDISVKLQPIRIHHVRTLRWACDANGQPVWFRPSTPYERI